MSEDESLRVVIRARPMNAREAREGAQKCVEYYESTGQITINDSATFAYDAVLPDTVDQETVYEKTARPLLNRLFAGFNATVLAYGQTGSGKTYTMGAEDGSDEMRRGIIPRLVEELFQKIKQDDAFKVTVSMYEVYGDNVYDLLRADKVKLNVHGDEKNCKVVNLTAMPVVDVKGALKQLAIGCHYRTKAETAMNSVSSRSHAVFTVFVEKIGGFSAKLQLVDLAGSERLKKTEAEGNRMKEGININSGLLILSQVISALATKQKHIPYRNSVLTRVLQDSLGGNAFTVFLACISPADSNSAETLNTLRYADRAKHIKNRPIVNKDTKTEEVAVLREHVKRLQREVAELKQGGDAMDRVEILSLKDQLARTTEELKQKTIKQAEGIVRIAELTEHNEMLQKTLEEVKTLVCNEEMQEPAEVLASIAQLVGEDEPTMVAPDDVAEPEEHDFERLPELQAELEELDKQIALKHESREKDLQTQREFVEAVEHRQNEKSQLVARVEQLESEISVLRAESKKATSTASRLAEERRQKLTGLEREIFEYKKSLAELKKLQETRRRMEETSRKADVEMKSLKAERLRLLKEQRAEAAKFQAFQKKHEREVARVTTRLEKSELDKERQRRLDEQKLAALQVRLSEANRANKMLRELNLKRAQRKGVPADAVALQTIIEEELELEATAHRCHLLCTELRRQRQEVTDRINALEAQKFEGGAKKRRISSSPDDPDATFVVLIEGEEEFEERRRLELAELRASLDGLNEEIKDSLRNETISGAPRSKWDKVPLEQRPLLETMYAQTVAHVKKEVELEFRLARAHTPSSEQFKRRRDEEEMKRRYRELAESVEEAKMELHEKIAFLLRLVKADRVDGRAMRQFESLRNQFCDVEHRIKKRRRTDIFVAGTPIKDHNREERARRAAQRHENNADSENVVFE